MQNLVVLFEPSGVAFISSLKAGTMILNRLCIDEDAGFEFSGVIYLKHNKNFQTEQENSTKGTERMIPLKLSGLKIQGYNRFGFSKTS